MTKEKEMIEETAAEVKEAAKAKRSRAKKEKSEAPAAEALKVEEAKTPTAEAPEAETPATEAPAPKAKEEEIQPADEKPAQENLLVSMDKYLAAGVHIGTQQREASMKPYIYNVRPDGLSVFNVQMIDERIRVAAKMLGKYDPADILIVSARDSAKVPADKLGEMTSAVSVSDRFMPGTLTNPGYSGYMEPKILFTSDPGVDQRAITEAVLMNLPVVAICDTNNTTRNIDLVIPGNNKGRKSIALILWLLGREMLRVRGQLKADEEPKISLEDFQPNIA